MQTKLAAAEEKTVSQAARIIRSGGLVAFPTETVYGLGANGLDAAAVGGIFRAKGRPSDNPLIEHICDISMLDELTSFVPEAAHLLAKEFWPGPLSIVMPKSSRVPENVTAGLETVAVRMPKNEVALRLIEQSGVPIAAPSANASGRPSPTDAQAVMEDMNGRIDMILDAGSCAIGVESTVLDLCLDTPCILRPGGVTAEMLRDVLGKVDVHPAALAEVKKGEARSPGMLHRHYAPRADMVIINGEERKAAQELARRYDAARQQGLSVRIICTSGCAALLGERPAHIFGIDGHPETVAASLFSELRQADADNIQLILSQAVPTAGMGLAVMNRMLRAAQFNVVEV